MKTIFFVRHGLTDANVANIVSGGEHEAELTDEGRKQAKRAGQDLRAKTIDMVVCSPMKRTVETAEIIARELGVDPKTIQTNEDFRERMMGIYSARSHPEYRKAVLAGEEHETLETPQQMHERVSRGLEWLKTLPGENIVLVSHGATGRVVKVISQDLHIDDMYKIEGFGNTEIYEFTLD